MLTEEICDKLQRLVIDENKIVTYKTLSRTLNIPVNSAKGFLEKFLNTYKADNNLGAYYIIIGTQSDELFKQRSKAVIVPEKDLDTVRPTFSSVTSSHVYCIYKGNLVDKCAIYAADYEQEGDSDFNKLTVINNPNAKVQSRKVTKPSDNNAVVKETKKAQTPATTASPVESKKTQPAAAPAKKSPDIFNILQKAGEKKRPVEKKKSSDSANSSEPQKKAVSQASSVKGKQKSPSKKEAAVGKSKCDVKSMFSKQAERNALKPVVSTEVKKDDDDFQRSSTSSLKTESKAKKKTAQKKKKPLLSDDSDSESLKPKKKKHRRIVTADDSESSSDNEEAKDKAQREFLNVEPQVPEPAKIQSDDDDDDDEPIPPTPLQSGKKKSLKLVTKTFEDEEGFFVTKKVKEYVTDSEESDSEKKAKPASPEKTSTKILLANKKQASLTNFFKRK